jgi:peptidoglycan/xylan/chitin deacetylase (PgdA/CDA1 family)
MAIRRILYRATNSALPILSRIGPAAKGLGIIMVHGVYDHSCLGPVPQPRSSVSLAAFKKVILPLRRHFTFVSMDDASAMLRGKAPLRKRCLVLTFDDSLKTHLDVIAPKLVQWGLPATFYLSTATIDQQTPYWWLRLEYVMAKCAGKKLYLELAGQKPEAIDTTCPKKAREDLSAKLRSTAKPDEILYAMASIDAQLRIKPSDVLRDFPAARPLSWDDAAQLGKMGMDLGGHTVTHPNLTLLNEAALTTEFTACSEAIERRTKQKCRHFCYPHGSYSKKVAAVAEKLGFESAVTADEGWNCRGNSLWTLRRFGLSSRDYELGWQLSGAAGLVKRLRPSAPLSQTKRD